MRPKPRSKLSREGGALSRMLCLEVLFGGRGASLHTENSDLQSCRGIRTSKLSTMVQLPTHVVNVSEPLLVAHSEEVG